MQSIGSMSSTTKKIIIAMVAVVVTFVVVGMASLAMVGQKIDKYQKSFAIWKESESSMLLKLSADYPPKLYVFDYDELTSKQGLSDQVKGCNKLERTTMRIKETGKRLPELESSMLGWMSSKYASAKKQSDKRKQNVNQFVSQASTVYEQNVVDCRWNIGLNTDVAPANQAYNQANKARMKKGERYQQNVCFIGGCYPAEPSKVKAYGQGYKKYADITQSANDKWYESKRCEMTSLKSACKSLQAGLKLHYDAVIDFGEYAIKNANDFDQNKIDDKFTVFEDKGKKVDALMVAHYQKQFPDVEPTKDFKKIKGTDQYFDAVARARIAKLAASHKLIKDL